MASHVYNSDELYSQRWLTRVADHMNSHKGVKPHKCKFCGNGFTTSGTARRHENQCSQNPGKQAGGHVSSS